MLWKRGRDVVRPREQPCPVVSAGPRPRFGAVRARKARNDTLDEAKVVKCRAGSQYEL